MRSMQFHDGWTLRDSSQTFECIIADIEYLQAGERLIFQRTQRIDFIMRDIQGN